MMAVTLLLAACGWSQQSAQAKKNAANPCDKDTTQAGLNRCSAELFHQADAHLNALYRKITDSLQKDIDRAQTKNNADEIKHCETSLQMLKDAERAWVAYRDLHCKAVMQQYEGGSIAPMEYAQCMWRETDHRIEELRNAYQLVD
jgi:uncharacterized protein YecT (DUF1311 family)